MPAILTAALAAHLFCAGAPVPSDIFAVEGATATFLVDTVIERKSREWDLSPAAKLPNNDEASPSYLGINGAVAMAVSVYPMSAIIGALISVQSKSSAVLVPTSNTLILFSDAPAGYPPGQSCHKSDGDPVS